SRRRCHQVGRACAKPGSTFRIVTGRAAPTQVPAGPSPARRRLGAAASPAWGGSAAAPPPPPALDTTPALPIIRPPRTSDFLRDAGPVPLVRRRRGEVDPDAAAGRAPPGPRGCRAAGRPGRPPRPTLPSEGGGRGGGSAPRGRPAPRRRAGPLQ